MLENNNVSRVTRLKRTKSNIDLDISSLFKMLAVLLLIYFISRVLFLSFPNLKTLFFIVPVGELVHAFFGSGEFNGVEWVFTADSTRYILGENCSGTTFFSLVLAYLGMRYQASRIPIWLLLCAYPVTLIANLARVLISVFVHGVTDAYLSSAWQDQLHLFTGIAVFVFTFLILTLYINRVRLTHV